VAPVGEVDSSAPGGARSRTRTWSAPWPLPWPGGIWPAPWPGGGARPASWGVIPPLSDFGLATKIKQWAGEEVTAGRLLPWLAVAYGFGMVIYFTAAREPAPWAGAIVAALSAAGAVLLRRRLMAFVVALFAFAIAAGFATATVKTAWIAHPILHYPASGVTVTGTVELREESQHTDRMVLRVAAIEGSRIDDKPRRVRLSVKRGMAPPPGSYVEVKALLEPPLQPLAPGSYDFARDLYFQQIGASGFVRGAITVLAQPAASGPLQRLNVVVQRMRDSIDAHVRAVLPGDTGAIAAMLLNGRRDVISENLYNALFISGVGHVLSISGYHVDNVLSDDQESS